MELLDLLFPKRCLGCGKWGSFICVECRIGIAEEPFICPGCGNLSSTGERHNECLSRGSLDGLVCLWSNEGLVKKMITQAKNQKYYATLKELYEVYDLWVDETLVKWRKFGKRNPIVVPVPLHKNRERERGFNQAEILGKCVAKQANLKMEKLLIRNKNTKLLNNAGRYDRRASVQGVFELQTKEIPKLVVLVDDIWISGATMQECAKVLKKAGVKEVWGLVLAR